MNARVWMGPVVALVLSLPVAGRAQAPSPQLEKAEGQGSAALSVSQEILPVGARLYVAPMSNGFETYVVAGLQKKQVPIKVIAIRDKADYELTGVSETDKAGWAKMLFMGSTSSAETASIKIVNLKTGDVVYAYSVSKGNSARGKQSAGEAVAKHIKNKIMNQGG
jgi:hypothetical protein